MIRHDSLGQGQTLSHPKGEALYLFQAHHVFLTCESVVLGTIFSPIIFLE